jgi:NitT/TauT family transport system permease protein
LPARIRTILESAHVFAGVLLVLVMAVAFNALIKFVERRAAVWQTGTRAGQDAIAREIPAAALRPANS